MKSYCSSEILEKAESQAAEMLEIMDSSSFWKVGPLPGLISPAVLSIIPVLLLPFSLRKVLVWITTNDMSAATMLLSLPQSVAEARS